MPQDQKIDYVELPGDDFDALEAFYSAAFNWEFTDFGPEYRAFTDHTLNGGFYKSANRSSTDTGAALVVLYAVDLESTCDTVVRNNGTICREISHSLTTTYGSKPIGYRTQPLQSMPIQKPEN